MQKIELNENWKMRIAGEDRFFSATVPGSVYQDLLDQGRMEDPYFRDNEDRALEIMKQDFEYRNFFDVGKAQLAGADEVLLRFHGLDTIADITLNGTFLKQVDNMHRTWDFSVKHLLKEKENELVIYFHSPVLYIAEQFEKDPAILGTEDAMKGFPKIRLYVWLGLGSEITGCGNLEAGRTLICGKSKTDTGLYQTKLEA